MPDFWKVCPRPFQELNVQTLILTKSSMETMNQRAQRKSVASCLFLPATESVVTKHNQILAAEFVQRNHSYRGSILDSQQWRSIAT